MSDQIALKKLTKSDRDERAERRDAQAMQQYFGQQSEVKGPAKIGKQQGGFKEKKKNKKKTNGEDDDADEDVDNKQNLIKNLIDRQKQQINMNLEFQSGFDDDQSTAATGQNDQAVDIPQRFQAKKEYKTELAKTILKTLSGEPQKEAALQIARGLARGYVKPTKYSKYSEEEFKSYLKAKFPTIANASEDFQIFLNKFFVYNPKKPSAAIFRKIPPTDQETRQSHMYRAALRVAKIIKSRIDLSKINAAHMTSEYLLKRQNIAKSAKTGSVNYFINRTANMFDKYGTDDPSKAKPLMVKKIRDAQEKTITRLTQGLDAYATRSNAFGNEAYKRYKQDYEENKTSKGASGNVLEVYSKLLQ